MISDNDEPQMHGSSSPLPDAHGRAALLLVESLIHGLCENVTISAGSAVEIAERAANVQLEQADEADDDAASMKRSHTLLLSIAASLRIDHKSGPWRPRLI